MSKISYFTRGKTQPTLNSAYILLALALSVYLISGMATLPQSLPSANLEIRTILAPFIFAFSVVLIRIHLNSEIDLRKTLLKITPYLVLLLALFCNVFFFGNSDFRMSHYINILHLINALVCLSLILENKYATKVLLRSIFSIALVLSLMALFGFNVPNTGDLQFFDGSRNFEIWSPLSSTTTFYRLMFFGSAAGFTLASFSASRRKREIIRLISLFFIFAAFKSTSFAAVITFFFGLYIGTTLLISAKTYKEGLKFFGVGLFVGLICITSTLDNTSSELNQKVSQEISISDENPIKVKDSGAPDYTTIVLEDKSQRLGLLSTGFEMFKANPLTGAGWGNFSREGIIDGFGTLGTYTYSHNLIFDILSQSGLVGFFVFLTCFTIVLIISIQKFFEFRKGLPFIIFALVIFMGNLFGGDYYDFRLFAFGLLLANVVSDKSKYQVSE